MDILSSLALFTIFTLALVHSRSAELIYEDGYTVTTVLDGNKLYINPHSVAPRPGSPDLLLLDSLNSVFYSLSLPLSQDSVIKRFSGNGCGYSDGDIDSAMYDKPRSFAMDLKGNVYVADRNNLAVRKISGSGVTTIAGGFSKTPGRADGPGRNATFSADYELTFVPDMCALLIVDHGHQLVRQIDLKQDDCARTQSGMGATAVWAVAVAVSCLVGLLIGFAIRPYIMPHEERNILNTISKVWTNYLTNWGRRARMLFFGTRSALASPSLEFPRKLAILIVSHLSLLFRFRIKRVDSSSISLSKDYISLLDSENSSCSQKYADQMRELISFDGEPGSSNMVNDVLGREDVAEKDGDGRGHIDYLMQANVTNFAEDARRSTLLEGPFLGISNVVKRR